ncbi:hypothetical protein NW868_06515 [Synechococcus sp. R60.2]
MLQDQKQLGGGNLGGERRLVQGSQQVDVQGLVGKVYSGTPATPQQLHPHNLHNRLGVSSSGQG